MDESQELVREHNARELWSDVENHLRIARESVEQALSALDDLHVSAAELDPLVPTLETWRAYADDGAKGRRA